MWRGEIVSIPTAAHVGAPLAPVDEILTVAGRGREGDCDPKEEGNCSWFTGPSRDVSLIEEEVLDRPRHDHNPAPAPGATRRSIVTNGVPPGHLIGRACRVGKSCCAASSAANRGPIDST